MKSFPQKLPKWNQKMEIEPVMLPLDFLCDTLQVCKPAVHDDYFLSGMGEINK